MIILSILSDFFIQYNYLTGIFLLMFVFSILWRVIRS